MKRYLLAIMAAFTMSSVVLAQETTERKPMSEEEIIKHRTERMVKSYGLDDAQAAKLLELNKKFASKLPRRGMRPRGQRPDMKGQKPMEPKNAEGPAEQKAKRPDFEQMKKNIKEYDAQLQTILTQEQYEAYKADMEKMRQRGPRNRTKTSK